MARTSKAAQAKQAAEQVETATAEPSDTATQAHEQAAATDSGGEAHSGDDAAGAESQPSKPARGTSQPATKAGMVEAELTASWASGGRRHKAGATVPMTKGTYERLKQYGRVK